MSFFQGTVSKADLEFHIKHKADISEVQLLIQTADLKFEDEFNQIHDQLTRKACNEDLQYYRKEQQFKASKTEVDNLRLDFNERIANLQVKIQERDRYIEVCNEGIASKLDQKILEIRSKFQSESECGRTGVDNSDDLRLKIKQLLSEREEDL